MIKLKLGDKGQDVNAANYALLGHNVFNHSELNSSQYGIFTEESAKASHRMQWWLGYPTNQINLTYDSILHAYLNGHRKRTPLMKARGWKRRGGKPVIKKPPKKFIFPIQDAKWTKLGWPYQGTHGVQFNRSRGTDNWESERAIDIGCTVGSKVVAPADGKIGTQFGPLSANDPRLAGIRLHLITADDEIYIAHLSSTAAAIKPGAHVKQGDVLGKSGSANGVSHIHVAHKSGDPAILYF